MIMSQDDDDVVPVLCTFFFVVVVVEKERSNWDFVSKVRVVVAHRSRPIFSSLESLPENGLI
jgi:hypothetical protein